MEFAKFKRKSTTQAELGQAQKVVVKHFLANTSELPLVYQSQVPGIKAEQWFSNNKDEIEADLLEYGAVLLRGFAAITQQDFEAFVDVSIPKTANYIEGATPRTKLSKSVYTSTEFPQDEEIKLHNELSYTVTPPSRLAFFCLKAPTTGGQTQIADMAKVFRDLEIEVVNEFENRGGWMLRRNYGNGFGPSIFKAFGVENLDEIKRYCANAKVNVEVVSDSHIVTQQVRPAVHQHPQSRTDVWFNHVVFWHPSSLCPKVLKQLGEVFSQAELPFGTYFGDGSEIPRATIEHIRSVTAAHETIFDWRQGDLLLVDNWRVAHGRKPFAGDRKILVAMG